MHIATVWVSEHLECPGPCILRVQNPVYCWPGGACWAAGQCGAQGPVMCGAGLRVRCWGGAVGVEVRQSRALGSCRPGAAAAHAGLSRSFVGTNSGFGLAARPISCWKEMLIRDSPLGAPAVLLGWRRRIGGHFRPSSLPIAQAVDA